MKKIILLLTLNIIAGNNLKAQIYQSSSSLVTFFSETPLENIDATNKAAVSVLNVNSGQVVFKVPIESFSFKNALMQEHFNENYMESSKYKNGTFTGTIQEKIDIYREGIYQVTVSGIFNIHGVDKAEKLIGTLTIKDNKLTINADFVIALADYKIAVPKIVYEKIAEKIAVKVKVEYLPYQKK